MHSYVQLQNSLLIVASFAFLICHHVRFTFLSRAFHASQLHFVWLLYLEVTRPAVHSQ